jgi:hypothetical protein
MCGCDCDLLVFDIGVLILRCIIKKCSGKTHNKNCTFLLRCYIGIALDAVEFGVLCETSDDINYEIFRNLWIAYGVFFFIITIFCAYSNEVYLFFANLTFKVISLCMALYIFRTANPDWNIFNQFERMDTFKNVIIGILAYIACFDVLMNTMAVLLKILLIPLLCLETCRTKILKTDENTSIHSFIHSYFISLT